MVATPSRTRHTSRLPDDKGNNFYVIKEDTCDVVIVDDFGVAKHVRTLSAGNSCGELSLLTGNPRSATIHVRRGLGRAWHSCAPLTVRAAPAMQATSPKLVLLMANRRMFNAAIGDAISVDT